MRFYIKEADCDMIVYNNDSGVDHIKFELVSKHTLNCILGPMVYSFNTSELWFKYQAYMPGDPNGNGLELIGVDIEGYNYYGIEKFDFNGLIEINMDILMPYLESVRFDLLLN